MDCHSSSHLDGCAKKGLPRDSGPLPSGETQAVVKHLGEPWVKHPRLFGSLCSFFHMGKPTSSRACKALTQPLVISSMACWKINPFSSVLFPLNPSKTYIYKKMFNCHDCLGVSPFPTESLKKQRQNGSEPGFPCTALTTAADSRSMWHDASAGSITQLLIYLTYLDMFSTTFIVLSPKKGTQG